MEVGGTKRKKAALAVVEDKNTFSCAPLQTSTALCRRSVSSYLCFVVCVQWRVSTSLIILFSVTETFFLQDFLWNPSCLLIEKKITSFLFNNKKNIKWEGTLKACCFYLLWYHTATWWLNMALCECCFLLRFFLLLLLLFFSYFSFTVQQKRSFFLL